MVDGRSGGGQTLEGEMGLARGGGDQQAGVVDKEFEPLHAGERIPADPVVTVAQAQRAGAAEQQADPLAVAHDDLAEMIAGRRARPQEVFGSRS